MASGSNRIVAAIATRRAMASGGLWMNADEGEQWSMIAQHLPPVHAVETAVLA